MADPIAIDARTGHAIMRALLEGDVDRLVDLLATISPPTN